MEALLLVTEHDGPTMFEGSAESAARRAVSGGRHAPGLTKAPRVRGMAEIGRKADSWSKSDRMQWLR